MMRKINLIYLMFFCFLLLLTSCFRSFEVKGFESKEVAFDWGYVGAKLLGSERKSWNTIFKESPYELLVWFGADSSVEGIIYVDEISLSYAETKEIIFKQNRIPQQKIVKMHDKYRAYISFENIELSHYEDLVLSIKSTVLISGNRKESNTDIVFKTKFQKFKRIEGV